MALASAYYADLMLVLSWRKLSRPPTNRLVELRAGVLGGELSLSGHFFLIAFDFGYELFLIILGVGSASRLLLL